MTFQLAFPRRLSTRSTALVFIFLATAVRLACAQQPAPANVAQKIDASVAARDEALLGYTVTERYRVFRNSDTAHPGAEMTVKTTYRKDQGKSFLILTQSGSELLLKEVLQRILDNERLMTQPANRSRALLTTANYDMKQPQEVSIDGRPCIMVAISPKRSSSYLFSGHVWVDAEDGAIVKLEGVASKSASFLTGPAEVSRQYGKIDGLPMATHASARSASFLLGKTLIDIDYTGYQMTLRAAGPTGNQPVSAGSGK